MIQVLLDTNVCIDLIRRRAPQVLERLRQYQVGVVGISSITLAELRHGVAKSDNPARNTLALIHFCAPLQVAPFGRRAAHAYGSIRAGLERAGTPIGPLDTLIAAHALALDALLVTNNLREFSRFPGLHSESWSEG